MQPMAIAKPKSVNEDDHTRFHPMSSILIIAERLVGRRQLWINAFPGRSGLE